MPTPITQREIARAAGVSRSTVTRALQGDPQISAAERARIRELARKLGYRPNPLISALMVQMRTRRRARFQAQLGYLVHGWTPAAWSADAEQQAFLTGAQARAEELGYGLEVHHHDPAHLADRRLWQLLHARGVPGILLPVPADPRGLELPALNWNRFAAVTIGYRQGSPAFDFAATDLFAAMWGLLCNLHSRGYRRPGVVLDTSAEALTHFRLDGALAAFQREKLIPEDHLEPFIATSIEAEPFARWFTQAQPDVVVANTLAPWHHLRSRGLAPPREVGFVALHLDDEARGARVSAIDRRPGPVGAAAVDLLTAQVARAERGVPNAQHGLLLEPDFFEGATLRPPTRL